ncbi:MULTISPECIES: potassium channel family protein [Stenotrophomonas]|uniref:Potassium channel domain-containing protein n=1 Tax=Stenotrophomonas maltophilia TaxID=40324 RepID=A0A2J0UE39_STEMA|nr:MULTISPECIES: potassium channel family protein [Stenotrophomonas]PJL31719.1 hypothetical protein B9Y64_09110 [Stenotrophomonas maltophilia]HDS1145474.1 two pore domain potassium channel family protein [Stenotrophomonas maltophilia]HDS1162607.1 two pore domain potassium channel family protein [Stenotrophomonas maltophilia]HEL5401284.1 two pore domain potassium channel family protein [Stenotrophomonas maltophilia]
MRTLTVKFVSWMELKDPSGRSRFILSMGLVIAAALLPLLRAWIPTNAALWIGMPLIAVSYASFGFISHRYVRYTREQLVIAPLVFVSTAILLILAFSSYYIAFPIAVSTRNDAPVSGDLTSAIYFSTATFTTLGYGDIVPANDQGRWVVMLESLLGMTHMVLFILTFLRNVDFSQSVDGCKK